MTEDHPRSRGVYPGTPGRYGPMCGSSPLARGLRRDRRGRGQHLGIIPARAGFTHGVRVIRGEKEDHPRSRGVYPTARRGSQMPYGSSPLARGLHGFAKAKAAEAGIIPARAGFTGRRVCGACRLSDHPRSRGVYDGGVQESGSTSGSSPLARGLLNDFVNVVTELGIIPARAGFTDISTSSTPERGDHPRSRGVYLLRSTSTGMASGSSPLARGLRRPERNYLCLPQDHPRSRGVYCPVGVNIYTEIGSSPLARGLPYRKVWFGARRRIIPARAGFTSPCATAPGHRRDHPRSRGVYDHNLQVRNWIVGSSPLARGLRPGIPALTEPGRIIPARAEFTFEEYSFQNRAGDHPRSRGVYVNQLTTVLTALGSSPLARGLPQRGRRR